MAGMPLLFGQARSEGNFQGEVLGVVGPLSWPMFLGPKSPPE